MKQPSSPCTPRDEKVSPSMLEGLQGCGLHSGGGDTFAAAELLQHSVILKYLRLVRVERRCIARYSGTKCDGYTLS